MSRTPYFYLEKFNSNSMKWEVYLPYIKNDKGEFKQIDTLLLFFDVLDSIDCDQLQIMTALAETGKLPELKILAAKPGWFTKQRIKTLLSVAGDSGQTEIAAWLLDLSEKDHKLASPSSLEL